jgi:hypothetical protein
VVRKHLKVAPHGDTDQCSGGVEGEDHGVEVSPVSGHSVLYDPSLAVSQY